MPYLPQDPTAEFDEPPAVTSAVTPAPAEARGCLFALSQPPLMLFLAVIGALLAMCGVYDLFVL